MLSVVYLLLLLVGITTSNDCSTYRDQLKSISNVDAPGYYEVQCVAADPSQYEPKQCWGSTGRCWCVDKWGKTVTDSEVNPGQTPIDCAAFGWCTSATLALMAKMGNDSVPMVGFYQPSCDPAGNFAKKQRWASTGQSWCAAENGNKVPGTTTGPSQQAYDCEALPPCLAAEAEIAHEQVDGLYPFGMDRPDCDGEGQFLASQCHGSTGHCWCVNPDTGVELEGSRKGPGEGAVDCAPQDETPVLFDEGAASSCQKLYNVQMGYLKKQEFTLLGFWTVKCEEDGSFSPSQCHPSTGHCWCVDRNGAELPGSRSLPGSPRKPCLAALPTCAVKKDSLAKEQESFMMVGMFVPECDDQGDFQTKQCWGSTGECWCVDKKSGKEVSFTRKSAPDSGALECSISGAPPPGLTTLRDDPAAVEGEAAASTGGSSTSFIVIIVILAVLLVGVVGAGLVFFRRNNRGVQYTGVNADI